MKDNALLSFPAMNQWRLDNEAKTLRCHTCALEQRECGAADRLRCSSAAATDDNNLDEMDDVNRINTSLKLGGVTLRSAPHTSTLKRVNLPARRPLAWCKVIPLNENVSPTFSIVIPRFGRGDAAEGCFRFPSGKKMFYTMAA